MATCDHCKTEETQSYENSVPICLTCATIRDAKAKGAPKQSVDVQAALVQDLCTATTRAQVAATDLNSFLTHGIVPEDLKQAKE
jgi:uncharacterized protein (DUF1501 family)